MWTLVVLSLLLQTPPDPTRPVRLVLAVLCVVVASTVALGVSIGLARRFALIANRSEAAADTPDDADGS
jgi:hypothetical protein